MKLTKVAAALALSATALVACSRDEGGVAAGEGNPLLAYVPSDTPYLYANMEPTPEAVVNAFMLRAAPAMSAAQEALGDIQLEINSDDPEMGEAKLFAAILNEVKGKLSREGLESLGLSMESHVAAYGMGPFPVIRMSLADASLLRASIERIKAESGKPFTELTLNDTSYWKIPAGDDNVAAYIAILPDHLMVSLMPTYYESEWLPALLGHTKPEASTAEATLAGLNRDKGFSAYGTGFLDLTRLAEEFLDENSVTAKLLASFGQTDAMNMSPVCKSEIRTMVSRMPRLIMGTTEMTANSVGIAYQLDLDPALAESMADLVADVPVADSDPSKLITASLGLKVGALKSFLTDQARAIVESPFQCEKLAGANEQASTALAQLSQPIPLPFINNIKGFRLSLDQFDLENLSPESARGLLSLEVEKPQMLIGMAQMMIPGMDGLELEAGSEPVMLPGELLSVAANGVMVHAAMGSDSIGVSLGDNGKESLSAFMDEDDDNNGVFFSVEYDMAATMELQSKLESTMMNVDSQDPDVAKYLDMQKSIEDAYAAMLGRTRIEMAFRKDGIRMDTEMTFK